MSRVKLVVLLLISFTATGSIIYQILNRRPKPQITSIPSTPAASGPSRRPDIVQKALQSASSTPGLSPVGTNTVIPASGWGRNPFLTRDEINAANRQPEPEIVQTPVAAPPPEPAAAPSYAVTAIVYGPNGGFAVVNSRVVQAGDRVGMETVKEIKNRAVVLEYDGHTRELPLRRVGPDIQLVPRGD